MLLHVHHGARPFPVYVRDKDVWISGKIAGEAFRVPCLHGEVELSLQRATEFADHLNGPVRPGLGHLTLDELGEL
jgi:hypothetical protein